MSCAQIPTMASSIVPGQAHLYSIEEIAEAENAYKKHALMQIVRLVELEEKSDQLRVHLNIADFMAEPQIKKATEDYSVASSAVFQPTPEFFGAKAGNFGVPTGIRTPVLTVKG